VDVSSGGGVLHDKSNILQGAVDHLCAVYSMGGGNHTILNALAQNGLKPDIFIAHDLDKDNRALLKAGRLGFILHHDLGVDLENVFHAFLYHHKLTQDPLMTAISNVQVVTPQNVPAEKVRP
jgi:LacI family transcriptional regulator